MLTPKNEDGWKAKAAEWLKSAMDESRISHQGLALLLKAHGFEETKASVAAKLKRGSFSAAWFLASLASINYPIDHLGLNDGLEIAPPQRKNRFSLHEVRQDAGSSTWQTHSDRFRPRKRDEEN